MIVSELIEKLQRQDPNRKVKVQDAGVLRDVDVTTKGPSFEQLEPVVILFGWGPR